jgi:mono/diheme cytochrome c family protein
MWLSHMMSRLVFWTCGVLLALGNASCTGIVEATADQPNQATGGASGGGSPNGGDPAGNAFAQCAVCHGPTGEGTALGYEIRHPVRPYAAWVVRHGRTGGEFPGSAMLAYGATVVSDGQLSSIFDYLDAFPQPTDGQGLYLDYCRNCHGTDARGGVTGVDISDKEYNDALEKVRVGEGGTDYGSRDMYMPAFPASRLSDADVRAIADYIGTL